MKRLAVIVFLIALSCADTFSYCDNNPWNNEPCSWSYWNYMRTELECSDYLISPGNPLVDGISADYPDIWTANKMLFRSGNFLMRGEGSLDELVFMKAIGEYYEFSWDKLKEPGEQSPYSSVCTSLQTLRLNSIRMFVYPGDINHTDRLYPFVQYFL